MPRVPLDPEWQTDGDEWWTHRAPTSPGDLTVYDDGDPEPVGWLELPDGSVIDVYPEREPFGYARHLGGSMGKQSILDEIAAAAVGPGGTCTVGKALASMTAADRGEFEAAMGGAYPGVAIARVMQARGHDVKPNAVQRHRKQECACGRRG